MSEFVQSANLQVMDFSDATTFSDTPHGCIIQGGLQTGNDKDELL